MNRYEIVGIKKSHRKGGKKQDQIELLGLILADRFADVGLCKSKLKFGTQVEPIDTYNLYLLFDK